MQVASALTLNRHISGSIAAEAATHHHCAKLHQAIIGFLTDSRRLIVLPIARMG